MIGKIDTLIPEFIDAGIDVLQAMQASTGMDVVKLKEEHKNKMVFFGNISETKLAGSKEDILSEISYKIGNAKIGGGYIYHSDHSIPDEVSYDNYLYVMEMVKKYGKYWSSVKHATLVGAENDTIYHHKRLWGYEIVCDTENGQEGIKKFKQYNPDVVITDIRMPVMDGLELMSIINKYNENCKKVILS